MTQTPVLIVGANIAGLSAALLLAEKGVPVSLVSSAPARYSTDASLTSGFNVVCPSRTSSDTPERHLADSVSAGDYLGNQELVWQMTHDASSLLDILVRLGVLFDETESGSPCFYSLDGSVSRTLLGGDQTGQRILYALDNQVRKYVSRGLIKNYEGWEIVSFVRDEAGKCRGAVAIDLQTAELRAFPAPAVLVCTGNLAEPLLTSAPFIQNQEPVVGLAYRQGAFLSNPEFLHFHPACLSGVDRIHAIGFPLIARGARFFVKREGKPWYFLEDYYSSLGNKVPFVVANRAIHKIVHERNESPDGVYLDLSSLAGTTEVFDNNNLKNIRRLIFGTTGVDPVKNPIPVMPGISTSLGGLATDSSFRTNIPGLYAVGGAQGGLHGANCLEGNILPVHLFSGLKAVEFLFDEISAQKSKSSSYGILFDAEILRQHEANRNFLGASGHERVFRIYHELGNALKESLGFSRDNGDLQNAHDKILELTERTKMIGITDKGKWMNQELVFVRRLQAILPTALAMVDCALARNESRGMHYKAVFPYRDDAHFMKISKAKYDKEGTQIEYEEVDLKYVKPEK